MFCNEVKEGELLRDEGGEAKTEAEESLSRMMAVAKGVRGGGTSEVPKSLSKAEGTEAEEAQRRTGSGD